MKIDLKKNKGITLIALVITIIVLLILAGVTISTLTGENGLLTRSNDAVLANKCAAVEEARDLWLQERKISNMFGESPKTLEEILKEIKNQGLLNDTEIAGIISDKNNEIKIGTKTVSFKVDGYSIVEPEDINDWEYEVDTQTNTARLISYKGNKTEVIVPNYINGIPVKKIGGKLSDTGYSEYSSIWNESIRQKPIVEYDIPQRTIKNVIISEGIEEIEDGSFKYSIALENITIPNTIKSIGMQAFYYCTSLTNITLPDSLTSIEYGTFRRCTSLTKITLPDSLTSIGDGAFSYCTSLTKITLPDSLTSIGMRAFYYCTSLTNITLPDSLTSIGDSVFSFCTSLTNITLPDSLTSIGDSVFFGCTSLTNITLPDSLTSIGTDFFSNCTSLTNITLPDSLRSIGYRAFESCTSLINITIPISVKVVSVYAFYDNPQLTIKVPYKENELPEGWDSGWHTGSFATIEYLP